MIRKIHALIHIPKQLLDHGPLRHHWNMRYEGKNADPKKKNHLNF